MKEAEVEARLNLLRAKAGFILNLLSQGDYTPEVTDRVRLLARELKAELRSENSQVILKRRARTAMNFAESGVYNPSIHEAWIAMRCFRGEGDVRQSWRDSIEEARYRLGKYLKSLPVQSATITRNC